MNAASIKEEKKKEESDAKKWTRPFRKSGDEGTYTNRRYDERAMHKICAFYWWVYPLHTIFK